MADDEPRGLNDLMPDVRRARADNHVVLAANAVPDRPQDALALAQIATAINLGIIADLLIEDRKRGGVAAR